MKLAEAKKTIGKDVLYTVANMKILCTIEDVKSAYGRIMFKLEPRAGSGSKWTNKVPGEDMEWTN